MTDRPAGARSPEVHLEGVTDSERHSTASGAADAIQAAGGWVLDFRQFSNASVVLRFELPAGRAADLYIRLVLLSIRLDPDSLVALAAAAAVPPDETLSGSLALRFYHREPDLRLPVPAVPG